MTAWLVALLVAVCPPSPRFVPADALAADIVSAVDAQGPLPGASREQTVVVMAAVAWRESAFSRDVDELRRRGAAGECGLWQVMPVAGRCPPDRATAARIALERMHRSFAACASSPLDERLAVYTSGSCTRGLEASRARMQLAGRWFVAHPPPRPEASR